MKHKRKTKHLEGTCSPQPDKMTRVMQKAPEPAPEWKADTAENPDAAGDHHSTYDGVCNKTDRKQPVPMAEDETHLQQQQRREPAEPSLLKDMKHKHASQRPCFHYHRADEPCTPAAHRRTERVIKVYYMKVQRKRGRNDVVWDTQEGLVPPRKRGKAQEKSSLATVPAAPELSYMSTQNGVPDGSHSVSGEPEQEQAAALSQEVQPAAEQEGPQAQASIPEWQLAPEKGFKCMACCRVFPKLADLEEHVRQGRKEGFNCHVFHNAFAWLQSKRNMLEKGKKAKKTPKMASGGRKKKRPDRKKKRPDRKKKRPRPGVGRSPRQ